MYTFILKWSSIFDYFGLDAHIKKIVDQKGIILELRCPIGGPENHTIQKGGHFLDSKVFPSK